MKEFIAKKAIVIKPELQKFVDSYPRKFGSSIGSKPTKTVSSRVGGISYVDENQLKLVKSFS